MLVGVMSLRCCGSGSPAAADARSGSRSTGYYRLRARCACAQNWLSSKAVNASDFSRLIGNNCNAVKMAISKQEIGFETAIGILEGAKQHLFDWKAALVAHQMANQIQPSSTLPPNPPSTN